MVVCPATTVSLLPQLLTTVSLLPQLLVFGAIAATSVAGFLVDRALKSEPETNPQKQQKAAGQATWQAPPKPNVVTRMKDLKLLQSLLAGPGRNLITTDRMLVLTMKELTLVFGRGAEGAIVATLASGDAKLARQIVEDAQARYIASVRDGVRERVQAEAPRAGWQVAAQEVTRDGAVHITLQKSRPKKPVAIG